MTKTQVAQEGQTSDLRRQLMQARQAYMSGTLCMEDYICIAVQCYAAEKEGKCSFETIVGTGV